MPIEASGSPVAPANPAAPTTTDAPQAPPTPAGAPAPDTTVAAPTPPPAPGGPTQKDQLLQQQGEIAEKARMEKSIGITKSGEEVTPQTPGVQALVDKGLSIDAAMGNIIGEKNKEFAAKAAAAKTDDTAPGASSVDEQDFAATQGTGAAPGPSIPTEMSDGFAELDAEEAQMTKMYDDMGKNFDTRTTAAVDQIKAAYARRKEQMKVVNQSRLGSLTKAGIRAGRARYAKEVETSILSNEERAGIQRLSDLDREEQMLIQQAIDANDDKQYTLLNEKMSMISEVRAKKQNLIAQQHQMAMAQEELMMKKVKSAREDAKFEMDVIKFQDELQQNNFDRAMTVAKNNGYNVGFDKNGNLDVLQSLTMENQIKADSFQLQVEKFGWDQTMDQFKTEMDEKNFYLDTAKFEQTVDEFGMEYAIKEANFNMDQQGFYQKRLEAGLPTSYDQLGMAAPGSQVGSAMGQAITEGYKQGDKGGQCVTFTHKLVDFPPIGDYLNQKKAAVDKIAKNGKGSKNTGFGTSGPAAAKWAKQNIAVGDVLITDGSDVSKSGGATKYGHGMVVTSINPDGSYNLIESNRRNQEKITTDRVLTADKFGSVYGLIRGDMKGNISARAEEIAAQNMYQGAQQQFGGGKAGEYSAMIQAGTFKQDKVPEEFQLAVAKDLAKVGYQTPAQKSAITKTTNVLQTIGDLQSMMDEGAGFKGAIGPLSSRFTMFGDAQTFKNKFEQLETQLGVIGIEDLRGLGSMSETELELVTRAKTALSLNLSEDAFETELTSLFGAMNKDFESKGGVDVNEFWGESSGSVESIYSL